MTCAKTIVKCTILTKDGRRFEGTNDCANPQPVCPREPGEGYAKCVAICKQEAHAEVAALKKAGFEAIGARAFIEGIGHSCKECQRILFECGVKSISVVRYPDEIVWD